MTRRAEPSRCRKLAPARAPARGRPPAPRIGIVAAPNHAAHGPEVPTAHQEPRRSRDDDPASGVWRRQAGGRGAAVGECSPARHHYPSSTRSGGTQRLSSSAPECGRENCPLSAAEAKSTNSNPGRVKSGNGYSQRVPAAPERRNGCQPSPKDHAGRLGGSPRQLNVFACKPASIGAFTPPPLSSSSSSPEPPGRPGHTPVPP